MGVTLAMKSTERMSEQGTEYQCSGLLEQDFPALCARAGITAVPAVTHWVSPSFPADEEPSEPGLEGTLARIHRKYQSFQPRLWLGGDPRDPHSVFLRGWKVEGPMLGVLSQCLPVLPSLQELHLWNTGLTEELLPDLVALLAQCPHLQTLSLEGSPLPPPAIPALMGSDTTVTHLSLRSAGIGDAAAELLGKNLPRCHLHSLVLSFNHISDLGAASIAQGLRLNRSLLSLSLANNNIGDTGATKLAEVLAPFPLTHAEALERRRMLFAEAMGPPPAPSNEGGRAFPPPLQKKGGAPSILSSLHPQTPKGAAAGRGRQTTSAAVHELPSAKPGKGPPKKKGALLRTEEGKQPGKSLDPGAARSRDVKASGQEKLTSELGDTRGTGGRRRAPPRGSLCAPPPGAGCATAPAAGRGHPTPAWPRPGREPGAPAPRPHP